MHDVVIIGAGPSGLQTARILSSRGLDVLVLERKQEVGGQITCTGIIGRDLFDEYGLARSSILSDIQEVKMVSPKGTSLVYRHPRPFAAVVDRGLFDRNIAVEVLNNGGRIDCGTQVTDLAVRPGFVDVTAEHGDGSVGHVRARVAVIATGVDASLNKKLRLGKTRRFLNGAQAELESEGGPVTTLFFGRTVAPGAFAWAVPASGRKVRIGLMTEGCPRTYLKKLVMTHFPASGRNLEDDQIRVKPIAQGSPTRTSGRRILSVGEAAGQVKTTTGGGVFFGLIGAETAADVILRNVVRGEFSAREMAVYDRLWKQKIQRELLVGYYVRKLCARLSDTQIERLFQIARVNGIFPYIQQNGRFDWHGDLILDLIKKVPVFRPFL